jgi:cytochrome c oxidase assembly protein subunit 15
MLSQKRLGRGNPLTKLAWFWLAGIAAQIALGAWTVWSNKAADVATAHVLIGALSLAIGALWCLVAWSRPVAASTIEAESFEAFGATLAANK